MGKQPRADDVLYGQYEAACSWPGCGWTSKFEEGLSYKYKIGDTVVRDFDNPNRGRCMRCKRCVLKITKVPETSTSTGPRGFWKVPTE